MAYSQDRPVLGATRARQGRFGRNIFWVLVFGIALTVLGFVATWAWKAGDLAATEPSNAAKQADAQAFQAPEPAAVTPQPAQQASTTAPNP